MKTNIILYNSEKDKTVFTLTNGIRAWGILLAISKGSFRLSFPQTGETVVINPYEMAYVPPNTVFEREVLSPIDFIQFNFQTEDNEWGELDKGKVNLPSSQVRAIISALTSTTSQTENFEKIIESIFHRIYIDNYIFSQNKTEKTVSNEVKLILDYIQNNLKNDLSLTTLSALTHHSVNGLIWKFRRELGVTPQKYIATLRISKAKELLLDSNMTISEISDECGYANLYYFSSAFKTSLGVSPSDFRKG
jgi:AraC-like DNA-binding protein